MKLVKEAQVSEDLQYHLEENLALAENVFRAGSSKYFSMFNEVRALAQAGAIELSEEDSMFINETEIGEYGHYEGKLVPLGFPIPEEGALEEAEYKGKEVALNKPKRGGSKKFYVYTRNPKTGNTLKVAFGAKDGGGNLAVKLKDPQARKNFATRHDCKNKTDKTKPSYWSCRLPAYAKALGLSQTGARWW
tara:strand:- start:3427 stop:3999 length:573 start_codon:yes stop_codon:yes gene_type:complete